MKLFLEYLPEHLKIRLIKWSTKKSVRLASFTEFTLNDWLRFWDQDLKNDFENSNILSDTSKREIIGRVPFDIARMILQKQEVFEEIQRKWIGLSKREIEVLKGQEAWYSVNPTSSKSNYRFQIGFRNNGCKYWRDNLHHIGCFNCGYFFETFCGHVSIEDHDLINQFNVAYETVNQEVQNSIEPNFDVIEFLSDGSFLNDEEISENVRMELFSKLSKDIRIKKILVETRPEYITKKNISDLLNNLTSEQEIEIAIGLETTDRFISTFCVNKGYYIEDVEEALEKITQINTECQNRCSVMFYVLVKPAYLNEREALEDAVATAKNLYYLKQKYNIELTTKLEPVVVPKGTILDVLYHDTINGLPYYFPVSYWTILEIIARLEYEGLGNLIRIGAREDMDKYLEIPAVYYKNGNKKGLLSRYDFLIYEAVQDYNTHHNFKRTLIPLIETAFKDPTLDEWKEETGINSPFFMKYFDEHRGEIEDERNKNKELFDSKDILTHKLVKILNTIEYGKDFQHLAKEYQKSEYNKIQILNEITSKAKKLIEEDIGIQYEKIKINDKDIALMQLHEDWNLLRIHIKILVKYNGNEDYRSIWIGIPTTRIHLPFN